MLRRVTILWVLLWILLLWILLLWILLLWILLLWILLLNGVLRVLLRVLQWLWLVILKATACLRKWTDMTRHVHRRMRRLRTVGRRRHASRVNREARVHGMSGVGDRLTKLVEGLLLLLVRWRQRSRGSVWPLCVLSSIANPIAKCCLFYVVCQSRRRNNMLLVPTAGGSGVASDGAGVAGVACALFLLTATQPAPEAKKYQKEKDSAADGAANDRPRNFRASSRRGSRRSGRRGRIDDGGGEEPGASRTVTINFGRIAYAEVVVNVVLHRPMRRTYTKRSSSQTFGGDALTTVILMVWSPFVRSSFLNKEIGTSSLAKLELTCWSTPSVPDPSAQHRKKGKVWIGYRD
jgi:hypothetical protein